MASYTEEDLRASELFSRTNFVIRAMHAMYEKAPHLTSHLRWQFDPEPVPYFVPDQLAHCAKTIRVAIPKRLCEKISCNPMKERDPCTDTEPASYYYVGDRSFDVQCQPACFNTSATPARDEHNKRIPDMPMLVWNAMQRKCRYVNTGIISYLEKPAVRSETRYELRINDMPTGFSRYERGGNPEGSGWTYRYNKSYCGYYDLEFRGVEQKVEFDSEGHVKPPADEDGNDAAGFDQWKAPTDYGDKARIPPLGDCKMSVFDTITDAIIGRSVINAVSGAFKYATGRALLPEPTGLPRKPELKAVHTVDGWRKDVNESFVLPQLLLFEGSHIGETDDAPGGRRRKRSVVPPPVGTHHRTDAHRRRAALTNSLHEYAAGGAGWYSGFARHQLGLPPVDANGDETIATQDDTAAVTHGDEAAGADYGGDDTDADTDDGSDEINPFVVPLVEETVRPRRRTKRSVRVDVLGKADLVGDAAEAIAGVPEKLMHLVDSGEMREFVLNFPEKLRAFAVMMGGMMRDMILSFGNPDTLTSMGISTLAEQTIAQLRRIGLQSIERLVAFLAQSGALKITGSIGSHTLMMSVRSLSKTIISMGLKMAARGALMLAKLLVAATSVVGWILVCTMLLDLLFQWWDPLGYKNQLPPELPRDMMESGEQVLRHELGLLNPDYEFEHLMGVVLGPDAVMKIHLESLYDRLVYLEYLGPVNSEGSLIDRGVEVTVPTEMTPLDLALIQGVGIAQGVKFDAGVFADDEWRFRQRVRLNALLVTGAYGAGLGAAFLYVIGQALVGTVLALAAVIALAAAQLSLLDESLVNVLERSTNRTYDREYNAVVGGANGAGFTEQSFLRHETAVAP